MVLENLQAYTVYQVVAVFQVDEVLQRDLEGPEIGFQPKYISIKKYLERADQKILIFMPPSPSSPSSPHQQKQTINPFHRSPSSNN